MLSELVSSSRRCIAWHILVAWSVVLLRRADDSALPITSWAVSSSAGVASHVMWLSSKCICSSFLHSIWTNITQGPQACMMWTVLSIRQIDGANTGCCATFRIRLHEVRHWREDPIAAITPEAAQNPGLLLLFSICVRLSICLALLRLNHKHGSLAATSIDMTIMWVTLQQLSYNTIHDVRQALKSIAFLTRQRSASDGSCGDTSKGGCSAGGRAAAASPASPYMRLGRKRP